MEDEEEREEKGGVGREEEERKREKEQREGEKGRSGGCEEGREGERKLSSGGTNAEAGPRLNSVLHCRKDILETTKRIKGFSALVSAHLLKLLSSEILALWPCQDSKLIHHPWALKW